MKLEDLCADGMRVIGDGQTEITSVEYDSRKVRPGALFFCISGLKADGHDFAAEAVRKGAAALMVTRPLEIGVPQAVAANGRAAMAHMSREFYGRPDESLLMTGITGTKGKTTTTYMIKSALGRAGIKTGLIGTIVNMIGDEEIRTERTTPESADLFALLKRMKDEQCKAAVMEVSSHSLELNRVDGIKFDVSVFTNLSRDHLDFHRTPENYLAAKKKLFYMTRKAAVNIDDGASAEIMRGTDLEWLRFGIRENADVSARDIDVTPKGTAFTLVYRGKPTRINLKIPGIFSVYNALAAASACLLLGVGMEHVREGLEALPGVAGRFEVLDTGGRPFTMILDYAHTPDSLESALETVRTFARGRLVCVFGCGGDRDSGKREMMGEISGRLADFTVITSDNPRTEDPAAIIRAIEQGIKRTAGAYTCIENRREAIKYAIDNALPEDIIVLAGKGHETYQEIRGIKYPFDEKQVVGELLAGQTYE